MHEQALKAESKVILIDLTHSLSKLYPADVSPNVDIDKLLLLLNKIPYDREAALDDSNQRLCRLLANTENQILM